MIDRSAIAVAALMLAAPALAAEYALPEDSAVLRPGANVELAEANCQTCHSVDYILSQPPQKGHDFWAAEVKKMIEVYKAPIEQADAGKITDYLEKTY
ncbi:cytochrome c [Paracoccus contaminans]|nr:cytochrome c [Paracoccus contaminans]